MDDEITSESEIDSDAADDGYSDLLKGQNLDETVAEKKLRLAKQFIAEMAETTEDVEGELERQAQEESGRLEVPVADRVVAAEKLGTHYEVRNAHKSSITCSCVYSGGKEAGMVLYTACKRSQVSAWDIAGKAKVKSVKLDCSIVLSIACSGTFLAVGTKDGSILVLSRETLELQHTFHPNKGVTHKGAINGLTFRLGTENTLYSASDDRSVKVWDLSINSYVETLYGHQAGVLAIDALYKERCLSVGGRDNLACIFKIPEESHLTYHGHRGSIDAVKLLSDQTFITGGADDGAISLWWTDKRRPKFTQSSAHGADHWICSLATLVNSDVFASGSNDGKVRLWRLSGANKRDHRYSMFKLLTEIDCAGFVNTLQFSPKGSWLIAGVGQEHRLGRWWCEKSVRNSVKVFQICPEEET